MTTRLLLPLLSALFALFLAGAARAAPPVPPVAIESAEFGIFEAAGKDELAFEPTATVPYKVGQRYGWVIAVRTAQRSLSVREEYLLPPAVQPAETPAGSVVVPLPRRNQVSQRQLVPINGRIYGEWAVGPGEPPGRRTLRVIVEGQAEATFEYEVR